MVKIRRLFEINILGEENDVCKLKAEDMEMMLEKALIESIGDYAFIMDLREIPLK